MVVLGTVVLGAFTAAAAAAAVWQILQGDVVTALALAGVAAYLGHVFGLALHGVLAGRRRNDATGVTPTADGLTFRYAAAPTYWLAATTGLTTVLLVGATILAALQGGVQGYVIAAVLALGAALLGWFFVVLLRLAPGRVVVSVNGIHHRGLTFTHDVAWHAVRDVVAAWSNGPLVVIKTMPSSDTVTHNYLGWTRTSSRPLSPFTTVPGTWLAADPAALLRVVAYYLLNPDDRAELATAASLRRING
jgi:hypothetical protein